MTTQTACPVCGAGDHHCAGNVPTKSRMIIDINGTRREAGPIRVPRQRQTIGKPGYIGAVQEYDRRYPAVNLVTPGPTAPEAADGPLAGDRQDGAGEAEAAATAPAGAERSAKPTDLVVGPATAVKERKPKPDDKRRKDGDGSK